MVDDAQLPLLPNHDAQGRRADGRMVTGACRCSGRRDRAGLVPALVRAPRPALAPTGRGARPADLDDAARAREALDARGPLDLIAAPAGAAGARRAHHRTEAYTGRRAGVSLMTPPRVLHRQRAVLPRPSPWSRPLALDCAADVAGSPLLTAIARNGSRWASACRDGGRPARLPGERCSSRLRAIPE